MSSEQSISSAMKKKLIQDLIELAIGVILLLMCCGYLQSHPAEKISFFSGYKVIYQQTEIFFQNLFGKNGERLKQKYNLESYYQVMITQAEEKPCVDPEIVKDLHETYSKLQKEPKNTLEYKLNIYIEKQHEFDSKLRQGCPKNDETDNYTENTETNNEPDISEPTETIQQDS